MATSASNRPESFIQETVRYLIGNHSDLHRFCIILPSNRSARAFRDELQSSMKGGSLFPDITTIAEWMQTLSGLRTAKDEVLLMTLFELCAEMHPGDTLSFRDFCGYARMLLKDFDDIDMSLAPADDVMESLLQIKEMEANMRDGGLSSSGKTHIHSRYLDFCRELPLYYHRLRERLSAQGLSYQGMQYRETLDRLENRISALPYGKYVFVGFSALSNAEEALLLRLYSLGKAELIVDCEQWYLQTDVPNPAGRFIHRLQSKMPVTVFQHDFLHEMHKKVEIIGFPQESTQADFLHELLLQLRQEDPEARCAVVLLKENLLLPVLYALPDDKANISMEYPVYNTAVFSLVHHYLTALENRDRFLGGSQTEARIYHKDLRCFLGNTFLQERMRADGQPSDFSSETRIFYTRDSLLDFLESGSMDKATAERVTGWLFADLSANEIRARMEDMLTYLDDEHMQETHRAMITQLRKSLQEIFPICEHIPDADISSLRYLLENLVSAITFPFESEHSSRLQINGMLETRVLDFDHVILLSANEGVLPNRKASQTLIPFDVRRYYDLPTYQNHEAVMTYHFFRLLQRASRIFLAYNMDDREEVREKSRLLQQISLYWKNQENVEIRERICALPQPVRHAQEDIRIPKSGALMEKLQRMDFSPSLINLYLECPLKFCFRYLLKLNPPTEPEEEIQANTMGTVIHHILEKRLQPGALDLDTKHLREEVIGAFCDKNLCGIVLKPEDVLHEKNRLILELSLRYLRDYLLHFQKEVEKNGNPVLKVEEKISSSLEIGDRIIRLTGFIDRMDAENSILRVIDYKTGFFDPKSLRLENAAELFDGKHKEALQLMLYMFVKHREERIPQLQAQIVSFQHPKETCLLSVHDRNIFSQEDFQTFEHSLCEFIGRMFDTSEDFTCIREEMHCDYCDFKSLCF